MNETDADFVLERLVGLLDQDEREGKPSASNWHRYELCPPSFGLEREARRLGQVAYQDSPEARSGERIHLALAGQKVTLSKEEQHSVELLGERAHGEVLRIFGSEPPKTLFEERFFLGGKLCSGRVDRLYYNSQTVLIQDFKSGFHEPDPAAVNAQLRVLSVLVALALRAKEVPRLEQVIAQIISGPYGVTETRFGLAELARGYDQMVATLKTLSDPHAQYNPGPKQCRYCPATLICPALKARHATVKIEGLPASGPGAAQLLETCELLSRQIEQIRGYYKRILESDPAAEIPGWALLPGPARREVTDWRAARSRLEEFIPATEIEKLADYSLPKLERLLRETLSLSAAAAPKRLAEILGDQLRVRPGKLVLKRSE